MTRVQHGISFSIASNTSWYQLTLQASLYFLLLPHMATYNSTEVPGTLPDPVRSHHFSIPCYMIRKWLVMLDAKARKAVHLKENPSAGL